MPTLKQSKKQAVFWTRTAYNKSFCFYFVFYILLKYDMYPEKWIDVSGAFLAINSHKWVYPCDHRQRWETDYNQADVLQHLYLQLCF